MTTTSRAMGLALPQPLPARTAGRNPLTRPGGTAALIEAQRAVARANATENLVWLALALSALGVLTLSLWV